MASNRIVGTTCIYTQAGEFKVDSGTLCRQSTPLPGIAVGAPPSKPVRDVYPRTKPLFAPVEKFSVRERYPSIEGTGLEIGSGLNPKYSHDYLTLNSLGENGLTASQVMEKMQADWSKVFPFGAKGNNGSNNVTVGQIFRLQGPAPPQRQTTIKIPYVGEFHFRLPWYNYVKVTAMTETTVTVHTMEQHILTGQVENGVFVDSTGEMWLYQKGTGFDNEAQRVLNYGAAPFIWQMMASNVRELIKSSLQKAASSKAQDSNARGHGTTGAW